MLSILTHFCLMCSHHGNCSQVTTKKLRARTLLFSRSDLFSFPLIFSFPTPPSLFFFCREISLLIKSTNSLFGPTYSSRKELQFPRSTFSKLQLKLFPKNSANLLKCFILYTYKWRLTSFGFERTGLLWRIW